MVTTSIDLSMPRDIALIVQPPLPFTTDVMLLLRGDRDEALRSISMPLGISSPGIKQRQTKCMMQQVDRQGLSKSRSYILCIDEEEEGSLGKLDIQLLGI